MVILGLRAGFVLACLLAVVAVVAIDGTGLRVVALAACINVALICFLSASRGALSARADGKA